MPYRPRILLLAAVVLTAGSVEVVAQQSDDVAFFENNIRPLLIERCVKCHGPKKAESGLRLDAADGVSVGGDHGPAVVPGRSSDSLLMRAVRHEGDIQMPPDTRLSDREIELLSRWIDAGAAWPEGMMLVDDHAGPAIRRGPITDEERAHWAYQPIRDSAPPHIDSPWVRNDIDRFLLHRLQTEELVPQPRADRRTLIRRATFDLTGLPPTPEEIDAFLTDTEPGAFARLIDRLLESRAYGERWGRHWLDVVRYADTAGETGDYPTPLSYKYRNWVIDAFNADKPYDQFIREQIAGDLLGSMNAELSDAEYADLLTATGFIAISRRFGFDVENYHHLTIQDTIDTLGQSVLGLTLGCARCHDHKFDPVNTEDYYAWYGIFESTRYSFPGSEEKKRSRDLIPAIRAERSEARQQQQAQQLATLQTELAPLSTERSVLQFLLRDRPTGGIEEQAEAEIQVSAWTAFIAERLLQNAANEPDGHAGFKVWRTAELPLVGVNVGESLIKVPGSVPPRALVVHPDTQDGAAIAWRSTFTGRVRISGLVADAHDCGDSVSWHLDRLGSAGVTALAEGGNTQNGRQVLEEVAGELLSDIEVEAGDFIMLTLLPQTNHGCDLTQVELRIHERDGERIWDLVADVADDFLDANPHADGFGEKNIWSFLKTEPDRGREWAMSRSLEPIHVSVHEARHRLAEVSSLIQQHTTQIEEIQRSQVVPLIYGAVEQDQPADAQIRIRGERSNLGESVPRKNLAILGDDPLPVDAGSGRYQLAQWLTRSTNPLTARVMANRIWQHHFGRGIVGTENDFGTRGETPTHPELLDWLATRFMEAGWSVKSMHRLIMNSAAYQQAGGFDAVSVDRDPDSRLLWRFNPRRLSAEEIRDAMLIVAGDLDPTIGGPHPFPAEDTWGFTQHAPYYGLYPTRQRSVYLMQQRLKRHPFLALFDGADPNVSTARRQNTTVPTQALFLMNSEFVHERGNSLAMRISADAADQDDRIGSAYRMVFGRAATADEQTEAAQFLEDYRGALGDQADSGQRALAAFARTLLTRNEFLFVD